MKYYYKKKSVIYRNFNSFYYLNDNSSFGYRYVDTKNIKEKIVSESGAVFLECLTFEPQSLNDIVTKILTFFSDVSYEIIKHDAEEFYDELVYEGFIGSNLPTEEIEETINLNAYHNNFNESNTSEFLYNALNKSHFLKSVLIELTTVCNERCIHCYIPHKYKVVYMESDLIYDLFKQIKDMNVLNITITGGEPFLHKDFLPLLRLCNENNFSVNVLSNLTLLNEEILEEMKKNTLLSVQTSLYSIRSNIHDEITASPGSCKKTIESIIRLKENDIPIQINCPVMKNNLNYFDEVVKWGNKRNIKVYSDYILFAQYDNCVDNLKCRLEISDISKIIENQFCNDDDFINKIKDSSENSTYNHDELPICSVCTENVCVSANGHVYPCSGWEGYSLGSLREDSLENIWFFGEKTNYLRKITIKDFPKCRKCADKEFCTICMMRNGNENSFGDCMMVNKFYCDVTKVTKKLYKKYKN